MNKSLGGTASNSIPDSKQIKKIPILGKPIKYPTPYCPSSYHSG
jgi:hypothetical protein